MKLLTQLCNLYLLNIRWIIILISLTILLPLIFFFYKIFFCPFMSLSRRTLYNKTWQVVRINIVFFFILIIRGAVERRSLRFESENRHSSCFRKCLAIYFFGVRIKSPAENISYN